MLEAPEAEKNMGWSDFYDHLLDNCVALTDTTTLPALLRQNEEDDDDVNHVNRKGLERGDGDGEGEGNFPED